MLNEREITILKERVDSFNDERVLLGQRKKTQVKWTCATGSSLLQTTSEVTSYCWKSDRRMTFRLQCLSW